MTLDHIHVGVIALLFAAGLMAICSTLRLVSPVRRVAYFLAIPLWAGFTLLYMWAFFTSDHTAPITMLGAVFRILFFGIALEGLIVPLIDRLEVRSLSVMVEGVES